MNIRQKCAAAIAASLIISAALNIVVLRLSVFPSFIELENQNAVSDIQRALAAVSLQTAEIDRLVKDYSTWDDTYRYVDGQNKSYVQDNLYASSVENIKINMLAIHDREGALIHDAVYEANAEEAAPAGRWPSR